MDFKTLLRIYSDLKCSKVYFKKLSANDNSKNQVYFGGSFDILNILPIKEIIADNSGDWNKTRFKTGIDFYWVNHEGQLSHAPDAQLILYPKYPEVRFSGFLKGSKAAPSDLMANRIPDRLLFLGVNDNGKVIGYVTAPNSQLAREVKQVNDLEEVGVFKAFAIVNNKIELNSKGKLLNELKRINKLGWINSKRLDADRNILPCSSSNCGGYTLEAELGITPNGYSQPDFLGWEVKQYGVTKFDKLRSTIVTLMTPEPTGGFYTNSGVESFIRKYGYEDKRGREARLNFGGVHKFNEIQKSTGLKLILDGYDSETNKIRNTEGFLGLVDATGNIAASWSFTSLLKHWNTKHANACYVPSVMRKVEIESYTQQYAYGNFISLGTKTDFSLLLKQISIGNVYYDPGIKLELEIEGQRKQAVKRRSQFRIKSSNLTNLYKENEVVDLCRI